jgi:hypothetical protein
MFREANIDYFQSLANSARLQRLVRQPPGKQMFEHIGKTVHTRARQLRADGQTESGIALVSLVHNDDNGMGCLHDLLASHSTKIPNTSQARLETSLLDLTNACPI